MENKDLKAEDLDCEKELSAEVSELSDSRRQCDELLDKLQRNMAEFDNFRKRTVKEKAQMYDQGLIHAATTLLPVIDNFERAINAAPDKEDSMYKGVIMIYNQLMEYLKGINVTPIECVGEKFDPRLHNAISHENDDNYEENTVTEELQKGYKFKDTVIRPSFVKVAN